MPFSIKQREEQIIMEFKPLLDDPALLVEHLITRGKGLASLTSEDRASARPIVGCVSRALLASERKGDKLTFWGEADALITQGLLSLLLEVYNDTAPDEVLTHHITFHQELALHKLLGLQRQSGFSYMVLAFQKEAARYL